ncbi:MAG: pseudouridine synthase [Desulfosalsimonas sp.]
MLQILYIDRDFVAVNKPAGLMVHRARGAPQETSFALQMVRDLIGARVYPVHRLDKPTSGVLVFGRHKEAASLLAQEFSGSRIYKRYLAVVRGHASGNGAIEKPLAKYRERKIRTRLSQAARTRYLRLGITELPYPVGPYPTARYSLILASPETGRYHQIRRHLQHISHPVIGDRAHGDSSHNRFFAEVFGCSRLLLTAAELVFEHPYTHEKISIRAPVDPVFYRIIQCFGWDCLLPKEFGGSNSQDRLPCLL